ncbi:MAG: hypothetical protein PHE67_07430 [Campylobacterales bacterium]|nr:hypothetical protein [Campylobacterales bacterium]
METHKISEIIEKIKALEIELESEIQKRREEFFCDMGKKKIAFKEQILAEHRKNIQNVFVYLAKAPLLNLITAPIIYSVIIPALLLDLFVYIYQAVCFPVYKIQKVRRGDYIIIDRHNLKYLNAIEKLNCLYCSYFNGLMGYVSEVAARTEQYWCPIKHAEKMKHMHSKYQNFFDYGDSEGFRRELEKLRDELAKENL